MIYRFLVTILLSLFIQEFNLVPDLIPFYSVMLDLSKFDTTMDKAPPVGRSARWA